MRFLLTSLLIATVCLSCFSQQYANNNLDQLAAEATMASLPLLKEVLSIPNDAFYPEGMEKNVVWTEKNFSSRGFKTTRIETKTVPLLLAERSISNAAKTVLIYLQMDGPPVANARWLQSNPYAPALKKINNQE